MQYEKLIKIGVGILLTRETQRHWDTFIGVHVHDAWSGLFLLWRKLHVPIWFAAREITHVGVIILRVLLPLTFALASCQRKNMSTDLGIIEIRKEQSFIIL